MQTVDTTKDSAPYAHPSTDDTIESHYASPERLRPHGCYDGKVFIGLREMTEEGDRLRS